MKVKLQSAHGKADLTKNIVRERKYISNILEKESNQHNENALKKVIDIEGRQINDLLHFLSCPINLHIPVETFFLVPLAGKQKF